MRHACGGLLGLRRVGYVRRRGLLREEGLEVPEFDLPVVGFLRVLVESLGFCLAGVEGGVGGRPRELLTVRPRTIPMNSSIRSVVWFSRQASATRDWGASAIGR